MASLKVLTNSISVNAVASIMDTMEDGMSQVQEAMDIMGESHLPDLDEAEFEAAFAELDSEPTIVDPPEELYLGLAIPTAPRGLDAQRTERPIGLPGDLGGPGLRYRGNQGLVAT